jgi:hypothetical protein
MCTSLGHIVNPCDSGHWAHLCFRDTLQSTANLLSALVETPLHYDRFSITKINISWSKYNTRSIPSCPWVLLVDFTYSGRREYKQIKLEFGLIVPLGCSVLQYSAFYPLFFKSTIYFFGNVPTKYAARTNTPFPDIDGSPYRPSLFPSLTAEVPTEAIEEHRLDARISHSVGLLNLNIP